MRPSSNPDTDFFWLGHTPCRTVLLVGMVVAVQVYDKRAIYTIDDGTAVIDCVLRYAHATLPAPRTPPRSAAGPSAKSNTQRPSPKKQRLDKAKVLQSVEPPLPITEPGHPVRVVGKVIRHYQSKQVHADSIVLCASSLDEIAHLERVIQLHKTKYSLAIPFVLPPKPASRAPQPDTSHVDVNVFSVMPAAGPSTASYTLPAPPPMPMPLQHRNRPPPILTHGHASYHGHSHGPSSPTASSIVSSTPSSPCKPSSPVRPPMASSKPKLRHPSRLHTRDLTANTFRLYVKHYMDNAPPPFSVPSWSSPSRSTCGDVRTPMKCARLVSGERDGGDDVTPRPRSRVNADGIESNGNDKGEGEDGPTLGFTLSHLRRVPELALLAARVVRAETRKRDKAERDKAKARDVQHTSATSSRPNGRAAVTESPRKKMKRLFAWAVVKLYEEGSIMLWDGEVRPLPVPPPPFEAETSSGPTASTSRIWDGGTLGSVDLCASVSTSTCGAAWALYNSSASASLYSHYHAPRRRDGGGGVSASVSADVSGIDGDADPGEVSDPVVDEEAYVPLDSRLLARYVKEAVDVVRRRQGHDGNRRGRAKAEITAEEVLACMQRMDGRWARVGTWAVAEALAVLKTEWRPDGGS